ncbi:MAG: galactokinase [Bacteroidota bacterium]
MNREIAVQSPGRINLIGEHIGYNGGFVLHGAIEHAICITLSENGTDTCNIRSDNYRSGFSIALDSIQKSNFQWHNYILGVINEIQLLDGGRLRGFDSTIKSNLPMGSGINSSTALECGMAKGLNELFDLGLKDENLIKLCRDAEHNFLGTIGGFMDPFAVLMGKRDNLIKLNCRTLEHSYIGVDLEPIEILLLNTNVSHNLADSEYDKRRAECSEALEIINGGRNEYAYLCDVPLEKLLRNKLELPKVLFMRALYAVEENRRTLRSASLLENGDLLNVGELLYESHAGLSNLYGVSCDELDFMVEYSKQFPEVIGSRMMGGGFGGCTINLVHKKRSKDYIKNITLAYYKQFNIEPTPMIVSIGDGVRTKRG